MTDKKTAKETILNLYSSEDLKEIAEFGCESGVAHGHIYFSETTAFFNEYEDEIKNFLTGLHKKLPSDLADQNTDKQGYKNDMVWKFIDVIASIETGQSDIQSIKKDLLKKIKKDRSSISSAPDCYQVFFGSDYSGPFPTKKEAQDKLEEFKENDPDEKEYEISECRAMPAGKYFIGDPIDVISDFENKEKWLPKENDVFQFEKDNFEEGNLYALFKAKQGPGRYGGGEDSDGELFETKSGYFVFFPLLQLDEAKCLDLVNEEKGYIVTFTDNPDCGYERQGDGCIDCGWVEIWTNEKVEEEED